MPTTIESGPAVLSRGERTVSPPSPDRLRALRLYFESSLALIDVRPENDRRSVLIFQTEAGAAAMKRARRQHHVWLEEHFSAPLSDADIKALSRAFGKLNARLAQLRPGRISG